MSDEPTPIINQAAEGTRQPNFKGEPRFPRSVLVAGVIWIALGVLGVANAAGLLLASQGSFESSLIGINGDKVLAALWGSILLLFGVLFLLAGFRIVRGAERGTLANGATSVAIGALFLINVFNVGCSIVGLAFLPRSFSIGPYGNPIYQRDVILAVPQLILGLLLLTAGRLALTGGSQYTQWREEQIDRRRRERPAKKADSERSP
jgi:hypothetical protein